MSAWAREIELREENGAVRAYRTSDDFPVKIANFPKPGVDWKSWVKFMNLDSLEAARQFYLDKWTWDEGREEYHDLVVLIETTINRRVRAINPL